MNTLYYAGIAFRVNSIARRRLLTSDDEIGLTSSMLLVLPTASCLLGILPRNRLLMSTDIYLFFDANFHG